MSHRVGHGFAPEEDAASAAPGAEGGGSPMGPRGAVAMTTCLPLPGHLLIFLCRSRPLPSWSVVSRVAEPTYWARPGHMTREQGMFAWHYQERDVPSGWLSVPREAWTSGGHLVSGRGDLV